MSEQVDQHLQLTRAKVDAKVLVVVDTRTTDQEDAGVINQNI